MISPLDSARLGVKQRIFDIPSIKIFLDINDEDHIDENIPPE